VSLRYSGSSLRIVTPVGARADRRGAEAAKAWQGYQRLSTHARMPISEQSLTFEQSPHRRSADSGSLSAGLTVSRLAA